MSRRTTEKILRTALEKYYTTDFIEKDPVSIPHRFRDKADIEVAAFLTALISWGNRKAILKSAERMLDMMDHAPGAFVRSHTPSDTAKWKELSVHRTFTGEDFADIVSRLQICNQSSYSLETFFLPKENEDDLFDSITRFRKTMYPSHHRSMKHISNPDSGSACKRLHMFLRWMVRDCSQGIDFGIWKNISPSQLSLPLDIHSAKSARRLALLSRKSNDLKAVREVTAALRNICPEDPILYDFALFSLSENKAI